jgi:uncharacterized protein YciI
MQFICFLTDKPHSNALRMATRPKHLEHLEAIKSKIVFCGPQLSDDGQTMIGSLFVFELPDRAAAEEMVKSDPYYKAGLFESTVIRAFKRFI